MKPTRSREHVYRAIEAAMPLGSWVSRDDVLDAAATVVSPLEALTNGQVERERTIRHEERRRQRKLAAGWVPGRLGGGREPTEAALIRSGARLVARRALRSVMDEGIVERHGGSMLRRRGPILGPASHLRVIDGERQEVDRAQRSG